LRWFATTHEAISTATSKIACGSLAFRNNDLTSAAAVIARSLPSTGFSIIASAVVILSLPTDRTAVAGASVLA